MDSPTITDEAVQRIEDVTGRLADYLATGELRDLLTEASEALQPLHELVVDGDNIEAVSRTLQDTWIATGGETLRALVLMVGWWAALADEGEAWGVSAADDLAEMLTGQSGELGD